MKINYTNGAFENLGINRIRKNSYVISVGNHTTNDFHLTRISLKKIALEILQELNENDVVSKLRRIKMKMTKQEVAELLLNMNEDMSNVECYTPSKKKWEDIDTHDDYSQVLHGVKY